ncbi:MAG TPA: alpha/beta hydrolase fold domain-containing protein, partial [Devosia sp.]
VCGVLREVLGQGSDRVIIAGDSAGACLAAGAAQRMRDEGARKIAGQLLIYPMIEHYDRTPNAFHTLSDRFHPSFAAVRNAWDKYVQLPGGQLPNYAVPTRTVPLASLPPAMTVVAENDPLRFEALAYADAMAKAGVPSISSSHPGTVHGFLNEAPEGAVADALNAIKVWVARL